MTKVFTCTQHNNNLIASEVVFLVFFRKLDFVFLLFSICFSNILFCSRLSSLAFCLQQVRVRVRNRVRVRVIRVRDRVRVRVSMSHPVHPVCVG